ncbi:MAG TPA: hypothetical protein VFR30_10795, partial [Lysobacter sp.]|nr:hypothetical protein [Lysobacter sp.]
AAPQGQGGNDQHDSEDQAGSRAGHAFPSKEVDGLSSVQQKPESGLLLQEQGRCGLQLLLA